jgi:hypothetical protein
MAMEKTKYILTSLRLPEKLYNLLYNDIKWKAKKSVNSLIIEAINLWLTKNNYNTKVK